MLSIVKQRCTLGMEFPFNIQSVVCFNEVFIVDKDLKPHKTDGFG